MNASTEIFDVRGALEATIAKLELTQRSIDAGLRLKPTSEADQALLKALRTTLKEVTAAELSLRLALLEASPPSPAAIHAAAGR